MAAASGVGPAWWAGRGAATTVPRIRLRLGSTRWSSNQPASAGWCSRMGWRVVGRMAPGPGHRVAHEAVDQGGLAGAGGTADDGEQRRVQAAVAGQDVVIELGQGLADVQPGGVGAGQRQRQRHRGRSRRTASSSSTAAAWRAAGVCAGGLCRCSSLELTASSCQFSGPRRGQGLRRRGARSVRATKNGPGLMPGTVSLVTPAGFEPALPP